MVPTWAEWDEERRSWISDNAEGAFKLSLKITVAGRRKAYEGHFFCSNSWIDLEVLILEGSMVHIGVAHLQVLMIYSLQGREFLQTGDDLAPNRFWSSLSGCLC